MLDIHIAKTFDQATKSARLTGIPLDEHAILFGDLDFLADFPLILRIEDYWNDAQYSGEEIQLLSEEIDTLIEKSSASSLKPGILEKLRDACKSATESRKSIFLVAD